jgi:hypothetical protein
MWFVLLSPLLLPLFRRFPVFMLVLPFMLLYAFAHHSFGMSETLLDPINDFFTYLACWMLGFAHQDGTLHRLRWRMVLPIVAVVAIIGGWLTWSGRADSGFDLTSDPMPNAFWSFAFVLLLLRLRPTMSWLESIPWLERLISLLNGRAVTIYLWHTAGIFLTDRLLTRLGLEAGGIAWAALLVSGTLVLTALATLSFGWVEDLAARRRPSLLPPSNATRRAQDPPNHANSTINHVSQQ